METEDRYLGIWGRRDSRHDGFQCDLQYEGGRTAGVARTSTLADDESEAASGHAAVTGHSRRHIPSRD
ncbi:hypothetical protein G1O98_26975 [Nostoc sp. UIC10630]|nr:hypothetical protein [Nostoc sp. UIC 10630]NEU82589.1 hypothetical protein [Nostoc sp. UIC 10630]